MDSPCERLAYNLQYTESLLSVALTASAGVSQVPVAINGPFVPTLVQLCDASA
jgi:hypothetical protein